ncbi:acyltransferase [Curtobacterium albidum]|uniref:Acyltransferase n=2 Tax=Curtobacterium citreum TaxID=2036 RepID=A0A850DVR5_9MICO|nr:acyltransferase [Curtobacterium albidum]
MGLRRFGRDVVLNGFARSSLLPRSFRWRFLRLVGLDIRKWVSVAPGCWFGGRDVAIGGGTTVNYGCVFDNSARITIEEDCDVGHAVMFITSTHLPGDISRRAGAAASSPIAIGRGTWIGARATILPGVTVGEGCVIAAGAVVSSDCAPHGLYAGVPAVRKRDLP